jgi:hypothetical protein
LIFDRILLISIAAIVVAAIVLTSNYEKPWLPNFFKTQGLAVLSLIVSGGVLSDNLMRDFWKPDDLVVFFRFLDPKEVGTNQLHLNYVFSNSGKTPTFIEDVSLVEVFYQQIPNAQSYPDLGICEANSPTPATITMLPSFVQSTPVKYANGEYKKFYTPKTIYLGGVQSSFSSLNIDVGTQRAISTVYEMDPVDWNNFNVVLLCPIVRFFDSTGRPFTAICKGFAGDDIHEDNGPAKGRRTTSAAGLARLLPETGSTCRISPF